jgi:hypothetical protein
LQAPPNGIILSRQERKMRNPALLLALAGLGLPTAAAAADPPEPARPQLICRGAQKSLGSRIRKPRKCMTAEQWQEADEKAGRIPVSLQIVTPKNEGKQRAQ